MSKEGMAIVPLWPFTTAIQQNVRQPPFLSATADLVAAVVAAVVVAAARVLRLRAVGMLCTYHRTSSWLRTNITQRIAGTMC